MWDFCYFPLYLTDLAHLSSNHYIQDKKTKHHGKRWEWEVGRRAPGNQANSAREDQGSSCPKCCLRTRDCLMSAECGRALQISSVVAMCGMCINMWTCKSQTQQYNAYIIIYYITIWLWKLVTQLDRKHNLLLRWEWIYVHTLTFQRGMCSFLSFSHTLQH